MSILISVRPKWCAKEYTGEKRGELRKGWFEGMDGEKFYIYCSSVKAMNLADYCEAHRATGGAIDDWSGKVIGEFTCERIDRFTAEFIDEKKHGACYEDIRKIWYDCEGEEHFTIETSADHADPSDCDLCRDSCLTYEEIKRYIGENFHDKKFSFLRFSSLVIYDTPKELGELARRKLVYDGLCGKIYKPFPLQRPPQSWCYVEEVTV